MSSSRNTKEDANTNDPVGKKAVSWTLYAIAILFILITTIYIFKTASAEKGAWIKHPRLFGRGIVWVGVVNIIALIASIIAYLLK